MIHVMIVHWIADFVLQTDSMATNKSTSNKWLAYHIGVYTLMLVPFGVTFAVINGAAHFITDYCTSRLTSYFWKKEMRHEFFVTIGFDQLLHFIVLFLTIGFINKGGL